MRTPRLWLGMLGLGMMLALPARADIYTVRRQGAAIVPVKSRTVSMDAEVVTILPGEYGFQATAVFTMRNQTDRRVESLVAFPVVGSSLGSYTDVSRVFQVRMRADRPDAAFVATKVRLEHRDPQSARRDVFDYDETVVWNVAWEPRETLIIEVKYELGELMILPGSGALAWGWELKYVVRTGNLWQGPIGRADISITLSPEAGGPPTYGLRPQTSFPGRARWAGERVSWHFENWTPDDDIWVRTVQWVGYDPKAAGDLFLVLPTPYAGDREPYSEATLDRWIERELMLARRYLPEKAAAFDPQPLRVLMADWLYHELLARHGDPFYVGKHVAGQAAPAETRGYTTHDNNYVGVWRDRFNRYGGMKGWYRPLPVPGEKPPAITLSQQEEANAAFLRGYLQRQPR